MGATMNCFSRLIPAAVLGLAASAIMSPVRAQSVSSDALTQARSNCLASVAKTVGLPASRLKAIRQTSNASGISVDVKVPSATAPWGCLTDRHGKVEDVHFKGSEGAL
jgi:hypothetical protein